MSRRAFDALCELPRRAGDWFMPATVIAAVCSGSIVNAALLVLVAMAWYGGARDDADDD